MRPENAGQRAFAHRGSGGLRQPCYGAAMAKRIPRIAPVASLTPALLPVILPTLLIAGCGARSDFPSLARRPAEAAYARPGAPTPPAPPPAAMTQGLAAQLDSLRASARAAQTLFDQRQPAAARAAGSASGSAQGSEAWSVASIAVAGLESARAQASLPLADLDLLETQASNRAIDAGDADLVAVRDARREVEAIVAAQTRTIDSLLARFNG